VILIQDKTKTWFGKADSWYAHYLYKLSKF